ncbi:hypothetical protein [Citrobacter enshiensis]|uniref:hypothetical protein n=1 Tax=Citrobacter enshiensis TaxID=2971264 RepID=UPI0023E7F14E|nr:hypothetical protein [Citrobacter enshiensis]WET39899.1 hypothetical protein P2W74_18315 [Citrobacter enshiensis]
MFRCLGKKEKLQTSKKESNGNPHLSAEQVLGPIALAASALGIILAAIDNLLKILNLIEVQFYLATTILWLAGLVLAGRYTPKVFAIKTVAPKIIVQIALTAGYIIANSWTYYEHNIRVTFPANPPILKLGSFFGLSEAFAAPVSPSLKLVTFYLNEDLSSFVETNEPLFGFGKKYKTYSASRDVYQAFKQGQCSGVDGEKPQSDVFPILRRLVQERNTPQLLSYLTDSDSLGRLARERGDIFQKVIFTTGELDNLRDTVPKDYEIAKKYILECIGIYQPVFTIVLKNSGKAGIDIVKVVYVIEKVGQVLGLGPGGPVYPEHTYDHRLVHVRGDQSMDLRPPFNIPPGETRSFNIRLSTEEEQPGLGWLLRVKIIGASGEVAETSLFQLYLNREGVIK